VLVTHDLLGLFDRFTPKFVKQYADFHTAMQNAFAGYLEDVNAKTFPEEEHSVDMAEEEWQALLKDI
jgi:3-methyl-2-oxobutanoate hydroxymethyltransferase